VWDALGVHCSANERRADEASRDVENWLKCYFMQDKLGEEYTGIITGVTTFGIFVQLDQLFVEGLVHVTDLGQDYFQYDDARHELRGERTGKKFQLTDRVSVQVVRVDLESRKIDLRWPAPMPSSRAGRAVQGEQDQHQAWPGDPGRQAGKPARKQAAAAAPKSRPQRSRKRPRARPRLHPQPNLGQRKSCPKK
jgi:ribonuclease R